MGRRDRGAAAVEFALIVPLLLALVMGIIEFGFALFIQATLAGAAREGARTMAIYDDAVKAKGAAEDAASPIVTVPDQEITIVTACAATPPDDTVTVTIAHPYAGLTGFFSGGSGPAFTLNGRGVMRCNG